MSAIEIRGQVFGRGHFFLIAGPCVLESEAAALRAAHFLSELCHRLQIPYLFKSSFDKANRTSLQSFRGPGLERGLKLLDKVRRETGAAVLTDVHSAAQATAAAEVVDVLQIPAFLVRQTDLLLAAAQTGKPINVKKGQFLAPWDMFQAIEKICSTGNHRIFVTERGSCFGYNNLVVDMRSIPIMGAWEHPVVFDATHSVQLPGGRGSSSGGQREFVGPLARAAVAAGADGVFIEAHEDPDKALCDGPNSMPLAHMGPLLEGLKAIYETVRSHCRFPPTGAGGREGDSWKNRT